MRLPGDEHVAHNGGHHGGAQAPQGLVDQHGGGVAGEVGEDRPAGPQQGAKPQGHPAVQQGIDQGDEELHNPGGQGGQGRAGDPQSRGAELAEDQDVIQKGVQEHGAGEDRHAHEGILRAALHADVHGADGVEDVADAHDPDVGSPQGDQLGVVGHKAHDELRKAEEDQGHQGRDGHACVDGHPHAAVDGLHIPLAPVLAHQDGKTADEAEDDDLHQEDGGVGRGDGGELRLSQQAHHEGVHEAQGSGDEVLQNQRQSQKKQPLVKAGGPAQIVQHSSLQND